MGFKAGLRVPLDKRQVLPEELSDSEGELLVRIARLSIEAHLEEKPFSLKTYRGVVPEKLWRPGAAFVSLYHHEGANERGHGYTLRGCIGAVRAAEPLLATIARASLEAAFSDPRFPPLRIEELASIVVEVTVLGPLEPLPPTPHRILDMVEIGVHGVVVERPPNAGLLLPQVALEEGWDPPLFLTWACIKAGLPGTCWTERETRVYRFRAAAWREKEPYGGVTRIL